MVRLMLCVDRLAVIKHFKNNSGPQIRRSPEASIKRENRKNNQNVEPDNCRPKRKILKTFKALAAENDKPHAVNTSTPVIIETKSVPNSLEKLPKSLTKTNTKSPKGNCSLPSRESPVPTLANTTSPRRRSKLPDKLIKSPSGGSGSPLSPKRLSSPKRALTKQESDLQIDEDLMKFAAEVEQSLENGNFESKDGDATAGRFRLVDTRPDYYPADTPESELVKAFVPSETETSSSTAAGARGPRIKHVCRRAAVALGKPVAVFPDTQNLNLSALPSLEKERVLDDKPS